jgi:hypothetical protein
MQAVRLAGNSQFGALEAVQLAKGHFAPIDKMILANWLDIGLIATRAVLVALKG